jgi:hypothetical protein
MNTSFSQVEGAREEKVLPTRGSESWGLGTSTLHLPGSVTMEGATAAGAMSGCFIFCRGFSLAEPSLQLRQGSQGAE